MHRLGDDAPFDNNYGRFTFQKSLFAKKDLVRVICTPAAPMVAIALGFSILMVALSNPHVKVMNWEIAVARASTV